MLDLQFLYYNAVYDVRKATESQRRAMMPDKVFAVRACEDGMRNDYAMRAYAYYVLYYTMCALFRAISPKATRRELAPARSEVRGEVPFPRRRAAAKKTTKHFYMHFYGREYLRFHACGCRLTRQLMLSRLLISLLLAMPGIEYARASPITDPPATRFCRGSYAYGITHGEYAGVSITK